jgi:DNA-binding transcriptional LysR family regulator
MDQLDAMRTFLAVVDRSSFAEAARALQISPAAATRAISGLESDLGLRLLYRTTRSVRLTERGAVYADRCRQILQNLDDVRAEVRGEDAVPRGLLSLTAPVLFGRLHVAPIAEALIAAHPDLSVRLTLVDRVVHLVEEGFDVAVRIGPLPDSALIAVPVARVRRILVASPAYLADKGTPSAPADLRSHRIVSFEGVDATREWRFGADGRIAVAIAPRLTVNNAEASVDAAVRGLGIARVLSYQAEQALAEGALVRILRDDEPSSLPVSLVHAAERRTSANVAAFLREARSYFKGRTWE